MLGVVKTSRDWSAAVDNIFSSRAEFVYHHAKHSATSKKVTWSRFLCIHRETCMRTVPFGKFRLAISNALAETKSSLSKTMQDVNSGEN